MNELQKTNPGFLTDMRNIIQEARNQDAFLLFGAESLRT